MPRKTTKSTKRKAGKIDLAWLRRSKKPLAAVVTALAEGKTTRDSGAAVSRDIERLLAARDPNHPLGQALEQLERELPERTAPEIRKHLTKPR